MHKTSFFTSIVIALLLSIPSYAQIVKVQVGPSISSLQWKIQNTESFPDKLVGYSLFVGVDYMNKKYFNFSSNLGVIRKGGKHKHSLKDVYGNSAGRAAMTAALTYVSLNTLVDINVPVTDMVKPFLSVGPRIDYLVGHDDRFDSFENNDELSTVMTGFLIGGGVKLDVSRFQLGLRGDYYGNFNKVATWEAEPTRLPGDINDKTFTIQVSFGVKL